MSRYIDATNIAKQIADFKKVHHFSPNSDYMTGYICALSVTEGMIANAMIASTADVVEVVRCKDCKHFGLSLTGTPVCNFEDRYPSIVSRNHYCSYGERSKNVKTTLDRR